MNVSFPSPSPASVRFGANRKPGALSRPPVRDGETTPSQVELAPQRSNRQIREGIIDFFREPLAQGAAIVALGIGTLCGIPVVALAGSDVHEPVAEATVQAADNGDANKVVELMKPYLLSSNSETRYDALGEIAAIKDERIQAQLLDLYPDDVYSRVDLWGNTWGANIHDTPERVFSLICSWENQDLKAAFLSRYAGEIGYVDHWGNDKGANAEWHNNTHVVSNESDAMDELSKMPKSEARTKALNVFVENAYQPKVRDKAKELLVLESVD